MASFRCYDNSVVIATIFILWWQFLWRRSLCSDLAGIDPEKVYRAIFSYTSTANFVASALVSVRLLCKHLSNLQNSFWQMVNSEVSDGSQRKNAKQVASKKNLKSGNLVLKMQVYQKKLVEKEHFCIKPKLLRQQDLSMVLLIVVIWKLKFLMNQKGKRQNRLQVKQNPKKGNLVLKMQVYQKRL